MSSNNVLLEINDLKTWYPIRKGVFQRVVGHVKAVDGVSFDIRRGETLALVGESGCGKSVTALSVLRLIPNPPGRISSGSIRFQGKSLLDLDENELERIRGNDISMIFQEPMTSLNPLYTVGKQISEALILHQGLSKREAMDHAIEMLP